MLDSVFRRRKKRAKPESSSLGDSIAGAALGDVFTITGLSIEYDDSYFIIERLSRYESPSGKSFEALGADGDKKLWVQWSDDGGLNITVMTDDRPTGLTALGVAEADLIRMDEEHSIDNYITYEGTRLQYRNSSEAAYFEDNKGDGEGFYLWEFAGADDGKVVAVAKYEEMPFQVYVSEVVPADSITLYKR